MSKAKVIIYDYPVQDLGISRVQKRSSSRTCALLLDCRTPFQRNQVPSLKYV